MRMIKPNTWKYKLKNQESYCNECIKFELNDISLIISYKKIQLVYYTTFF